MKRQRISSAKISAGNARPVLRSSTNLNQIIRPSPAAWMSYKNLIKVVGVDCETGPSSWRKAIDHSAETVVFYQVDLRGTIPRMAKSVRVCLEEGSSQNKQLRLVPSVYVGSTLVSPSYVQTVIGRRFLADEDDLMKLLEHAGILDHENVQELDEVGHDDGDEGVGENEPLIVEPEAKRTKTIPALVPHSVTRSASKKSRIPAFIGTASTAHMRISQQSVIIHTDDSAADQSSSSIREDVQQQSPSMEPDLDISGLPMDDDKLRGQRRRTANAELDDGQDEIDEPADIPTHEPETADPESIEDIPPFTNDEITALIEEVQVNLVIWGTAKPNLVHRQAAWSTVAEAVSRLTQPGQTEKTAEHCKRKWGSLMASFRRIWRTNKLVAGWLWTEKLLFVVPSLEARRGKQGSAPVSFTEAEGD